MNINTEFTIRELLLSDYSKHYNVLLNQLSPTKFNLNQFQISLHKIQSNNNHKIFVIESNQNKKIIGTITILIEKKLIHNLSCVGHIEDVIVDKNFRGLGLGKKLVDYAITYCKNNSCYKVILNCNENLIHFYENCGFLHKNYEMSLYF